MSQTRLGKEIKVKDVAHLFTCMLLRLQLCGQLLSSTAVCDQAGGEQLLRQGVERDGGGCAGFCLFAENYFSLSVNKVAQVFGCFLKITFLCL